MLRRTIAAVAVALACTSAVARQFYIVNVQRIDQDLYEVQGQNIVLKTQFCYTFYMGQAVVRVDGPAGPMMGKIWFGDDQMCQLVAIYNKQ